MASECGRGQTIDRTFARRISILPGILARTITSMALIIPPSGSCGTSTEKRSGESGTCTGTCRCMSHCRWGFVIPSLDIKMASDLLYRTRRQPKGFQRRCQLTTFASGRNPATQSRRLPRTGQRKNSLRKRKPSGRRMAGRGIWPKSNPTSPNSTPTKMAWHRAPNDKSGMPKKAAESKR